MEPAKQNKTVKNIYTWYQTELAHNHKKQKTEKIHKTNKRESQPGGTFHTSFSKCHLNPCQIGVDILKKAQRAQKHEHRSVPPSKVCLRSTPSLRLFELFKGHAEIVTAPLKSLLTYSVVHFYRLIFPSTTLADSYCSEAPNANTGYNRTSKFTRLS